MSRLWAGSIGAEIALIARMAEFELSNVKVAERLGVDEKAVRRLVNLNLDALEDRNGFGVAWQSARSDGRRGVVGRLLFA